MSPHFRRNYKQLVLEDYERAVANVVDFIRQGSPCVAGTSLLGELDSPSG